MDFALLPHLSVVGRIANSLNISHTRRGVPFVKLLVYMCHGKNAKLMPMVGFNKVAKRLANEANQGDLLLLQARIDPLPSHRYITPTLIVSEFSHLESKTIRNVYHGRKGKQLKALFPVAPDNYFRPRRHRKSKKSNKYNHKNKNEQASHKSAKKTVHKHKPEKVKASDVTVIPSHRHKTKPKKNKDPFKDGNWVKEAEKLTHFDFPDLH